MQLSKKNLISLRIDNSKYRSIGPDIIQVMARLSDSWYSVRQTRSATDKRKLLYRPDCFAKNTLLMKC